MDSFEEKVEFLEKRKKGAVLLPFFIFKINLYSNTILPNICLQWLIENSLTKVTTTTQITEKIAKLFQTDIDLSKNL